MKKIKMAPPHRLFAFDMVALFWINSLNFQNILDKQWSNHWIRFRMIRVIIKSSVCVIDFRFQVGPSHSLVVNVARIITITRSNCQDLKIAYFGKNFHKCECFRIFTIFYLSIISCKRRHITGRRCYITLCSSFRIWMLREMSWPIANMCRLQLQIDVKQICCELPTK